MTLDRPLRKLVGILAEQPGVPVSHDVLAERMWPGVEYADEHAKHHLRQLVHRIRETYQDEEGELVIATYPRVGYVWVGDKPR